MSFSSRSTSFYIASKNSTFPSKRRFLDHFFNFLFRVESCIMTYYSENEENIGAELRMRPLDIRRTVASLMQPKCMKKITSPLENRNMKGNLKRFYLYWMTVSTFSSSARDRACFRDWEKYDGDVTSCPISTFQLSSTLPTANFFSETRPTHSITSPGGGGMRADRRDSWLLRRAKKLSTKPAALCDSSCTDGMESH